MMTWGELGMALLMGSAPVLLVASGIQWVVLRRAGVHSGRIALSVLGAIVVALPLTLAAWWASGFLPPDVFGALPWYGWVTGSLSMFFAYVGPPAIVASAIAFPSAAWIARQGVKRSSMMARDRG